MSRTPIFWNDFVLDTELGALLSVEMEPGVEIKVCRGSRTGRPSVMDDAIDIQETRQEHGPARMVGLSSLDFNRSGMEARRNNQDRLSRLRGEE